MLNYLIYPYFLTVYNSIVDKFIFYYRKKTCSHKYIYFHGFVGSIMAGFFLMLDRGTDSEICIFTIPSLPGYFQMVISN